MKVYFSLAGQAPADFAVAESLLEKVIFTEQVRQELDVCSILEVLCIRYWVKQGLLKDVEVWCPFSNSFHKIDKDGRWETTPGFEEKSPIDAFLEALI